MLPPSQVEDDNNNAHGSVQIPPPDIKKIVDKFARFMATIQPQSEKRIIANNADGSLRKYGFLYDGDIYHPYYQHQMADLRAQDGYVKTDRIWPKWFTDTVEASASYQTRDVLKWYKGFAEMQPATVVSPITHELIPVSSMFEHMRDPKLNELKERLFTKIRGETALAKDEEISRIIALLAWTRPKIFGTTEEEFFNAVKANIKPVLDLDGLSKAMRAEPEPKRQRLDDGDNCLLVPEDQFLAQHSGPVCITVFVAKTPRKLEISVKSLSESVSSFKEKIAREIEVPANKQKLSGKTGYLKDNLSLAHYNVGGAEKLFLWLC